MIEHILLVQWKPGTSQETIAKALTELRALKGKIDGIVDLTCGENFSDRAKGFTHGLAVRFVNRAALDAYFPHPEHQRVVQEFIAPYRADTVVLDYEF